jgi:flavin reductase (DIM6/NTAB) family NADH-FMN oxidoreductase RutF
MARRKIGFFDAAKATFERLASPGAFLVSGVEKPNVMAIGWGALGVAWGRPIFAVLVRPSRHTHSLLERHGEFTVCIPQRQMKDLVMLCGTKSGRSHDKVRECGFTMRKGNRVKVPYIVQCPVHYECRVVQRNEVLAGTFIEAIRRQYYPRGDYHGVYYGEILGTYRETRRPRRGKAERDA